MTNKMATIVLFYAQRSPSYGDSKATKLKIMAKKIVLPSLRPVYGDWVFLDAAKNDTIFSRNYIRNGE